MSAKTKQTSKSLSAQPGFLKPTIAYQQRCMTTSKSCATKTKKKKRGKKIKQSDLSHGSVSKSPPIKHKKDGDMKSAVQFYGSKSLSDSERNGDKTLSNQTSLSPGNEYSGLEEAKKMCEELREQINELRSHQESYERQMKDLSVTVNTQQNKSSYTHNSTIPTPQDENVHIQEFQKANEYWKKSVQSNQSNNPFIKVNVKPKSTPFNDASNLPEVVLYGDTFRKTELSESVIKKLHSERDKYKRKVLKLQTELKIVKQNKETILKNPEISSNDLSYYNADLIGEGRLAAVYDGTLCGKPVAVKKLIRNNGVMTSSDRSYLVAEAGLLLPLQHQNIVRVIGVCSTPVEPLIITEFVYGKTVLDLLKKSECGGLDPGTFFSVSQDTAIGLAYLHSQKPPVLHLNLRPSNILVDGFLKAKVSDFGFSKIRIDAGVSNCSNLSYLAPELMKFPAKITIKTDVYAFAILMWQMATGCDPMAAKSTSQILDMVQRGERLRIPSDLPNSFHQLISSCWDSSPVKRPSFKEIILQLETMILPDDWISKLKKVGICRIDTSDMVSVTTTVDSKPTSSPIPTDILSSHQEPVDFNTSRKTQYDENCGAGSCISVNSNQPHSTHYNKPSAVNIGVIRKWDTSDSTLSFMPANDESHKLTYRSEFDMPVRSDQVRYISHNMGDQINTPEVVLSAKRYPEFVMNGNQLNSHFSFADQRSSVSSESDRLKRESRSTSSDSDRPKSFRLRNPLTKFDEKFQDFVSTACIAESSSKVNLLPNWTHDSTSAPKTRTKSLLSSDNIQVRSISTQSRSSPATSKTSSIDTAVYLPRLAPDYSRPPHSALRSTDADVRVSSLPSAEYDPTSVVDDLNAEIDKSSAILNNARRLLDTSPLRKTDNSLHKSLSYPSRKTSSIYESTKPLPEYVPKQARSDHRYTRSEPTRVYCESFKSDTSLESFLHLPPKLPTPHYSVLPLSLNDSTSQPRDSTTGSMLSSYRSKPKIAFVNSAENESSLRSTGYLRKGNSEPGRSDDVSVILNRTAEELGTACDIIHSATEQIKRGNNRKTCGSV